MWERFSYYGMRGFLILYMTKALGFTDPHAGAVYGNYVGSVWLAAIFGGIIADRWLGDYRSVLIGGVLLPAGPLSPPVSCPPLFFPRPFFVVIRAAPPQPHRFAPLRLPST